MTFREALADFTEPLGYVSDLKYPDDRSSDNPLLFTCTAMILLDDFQSDDFAKAQRLISWCEVMPGLYTRRPNGKDFTSHDDLTGIAAYAFVRGPIGYAQRLAAWGEAQGWKWPTQMPDGRLNWLGRIIDFPPTVKAAAGQRLNFFDRVRVCIGFLANCFEKREETSGKCLLYLKSRVLYGRYKSTDWAIRVWRRKMKSLYPGGMRDVYGIYFGLAHPFSIYGPEDFS